RVAARDRSGLLLKLPPVAVSIVTFDLVCSTGGAPQEAGWETEPSADAAAVAGFATAGGAMYCQLTGFSPSSSILSIPALSTALRYISRSLWARPSSRIHAAWIGSAWILLDDHDGL